MDVRNGTPILYWWGTVAAGAPLSIGTPIASGYIGLVLGVDVYPTIQPNNGDFQFNIVVGGGGSVLPVYQIQQSQNFPGPFHWRGVYPAYAGDSNWEINSSVPFTFSIWGWTVPDSTQDSKLEF